MVTLPKHSSIGIFRERNIEYTDVFASLSNRIRLRCLYLTAQHDEVCVCEVVDTLGVSQPTVSKAFKALKEAGLVTDRRDATWIYYRLNDSAPKWIKDIVKATIAGLSTDQAFVDDENNYERAAARSADVC